MDYIDLQVLATCFRAKITAPGIFGRQLKMIRYTYQPPRNSTFMGYESNELGSKSMTPYFLVK